MEENKITAADVAHLIDASVNADTAVQTAIESAATALSVAAVATFEAITSGVKPADIAALTFGTNKDTVARLAIVGQFLMLEDNYTGPNTVDTTAASVGAIGKAHYVRSVVIKAIKAKVSIKDIRAAVTGTQRDAMKALKALLAPAADPTEPEGNDDTPESEVLGIDFAMACRAAVRAIETAMSAMPDTADMEDTAAVLAIADAVALLSRTFAAVPVAEVAAVEAVAV